MDEKIREYQESVASILRNEYFPTDEGYTMKIISKATLLKQQHKNYTNYIRSNLPIKLIWATTKSSNYVIGIM